MNPDSSWKFEILLVCCHLQELLTHGKMLLFKDNPVSAWNLHVIL